MFQPDQYMASLIDLLKRRFGYRLAYVGLQGSYLRGEATERSDIDVMAVIVDMTVADLEAYREIIAGLDGYEKSCGFICGLKELLHWNPLEICHLLHTTRDCFGTLAELVPAYTEGDVRAFVKMSLGNMYHELCHRYVHSPRAQNAQTLGGTYKGVFFILQNLHYLECGSFIGTKRELLEALSGKDRRVLETAVSFADGAKMDFDEAFALLLSWCREALIRTSSLTGASL